MTGCPQLAACPSSETIDQWYNHVGSSAAPADEITQHVGVVNRQLDGDAEAAAMEVVAREGDDGMRAVNRFVEAENGVQSPTARDSPATS